jgi:hypothetical protein
VAGDLKDKPIYKHLESELARAEAASSTVGPMKRHEPTVENHKGQAIALKKALTLLEIEQTTPPTPLTLNREYKITISWWALALIAIILTCLKF